MISWSITHGILLYVCSSRLGFAARYCLDIEWTQQSCLISLIFCQKKHLITNEMYCVIQYPNKTVFLKYACLGHKSDKHLGKQNAVQRDSD